MSDGFKCPGCGKDFRGAQKIADSATPRPAHLALLESKGQDAAVDAAQPSSNRKRLVSTAGPSVPVRKQLDDAVPNSWMARLEAARAAATGSGEPAAASATTERVPQGAPKPPPLKPSGGAAPRNAPAARTKTDDIVPVKPAHLLVAQLEEEDRKRRDDEMKKVAQIYADGGADEISAAKVQLETEPPKRRRVPEWIIAVLLISLILGAVGTGYVMVNREPAPKATIDPKLAAQAATRKQAMAHLEEGHRLALEGKARADEAIASYEKALKLEPTLASAERGLAIAYAAKDDEATAVAHYRRYLELLPNAGDAQAVRQIIEKYEKAKAKKP